MRITAVLGTRRMEKIESFHTIIPIYNAVIQLLDNAVQASMIVGLLLSRAHYTDYHSVISNHCD